MKTKKLYWSILLCVVFVVECRGQINSIPGTGQSTFNLDVSADCDGRTREVGQATSFISGKSSLPQGRPVTSCTLTLSTENIREPQRFKLQYLAVTIKDPGVAFYVYDGESGGRLKWAFNNQNEKPSNLDFEFTTGQLVTFKLSRGEMDTHYDIRVVAQPVTSDVQRCTYEGQYGCDEYGYTYRLLGTKEIIGIVAGCFGLVVLIVVIIVICCYRRQRGITKKWTEEKLGHVNTAASLHSLNGKVNTGSSAPRSNKPWTSESSKNGFATIRRSPQLPRAKIARSHRTADADSTMFDSNASLPLKRPLPPPQVNHNPRGTSSRSRGRNFSRDKFRDDDDSYSDGSVSTDRNCSEKTFSERNYSERNYRPPTYREALRHDDSESADENSFVQANESHQQHTFVERVITPRTRKKTSPVTKRATNAKPSPPPPEFDETYDSIEPKKLSKALMVEKGAGSSEEDESEESDSENESEEEEEAESEEEEGSEAESDKVDKAVYSTPNKNKSKSGGAKPKPVKPQGAFRPPPSQQPQQFQGVPYPGYLPPGVHQPQPRYPGYPAPPQPYLQGQPAFPQGQQPYIPQPHQSQPHPYHQANFTVSMPPQNAPNQYAPPHQTQPQSQPKRDHSRRPRDQPAQAQPSNPPMYSYLVNRGYNGRHSPVSTSTGASNLSGDRNLQTEESDFSANLDSGVELMKRKNYSVV